MANNANTLGRLNEILFAELERLNALDFWAAARTASVRSR